MGLHPEVLCRDDMAMLDYRLYVLDRKDRIQRRIDLECRDDAHAVEAASEHAFHDATELWQGDRLIRHFEPQEL